jgi:TRAP-type C4-dicarboxylate transport system permease small subunit
MKFLSRVETALALVFAAGMAGVLFLFVVAEVVGRYVFNHPIPGHTEGSILLLFVIAFGALAHVQRRDSHISMDLLFRRLPARVQDICQVVTTGVATLVFVLLTYKWGATSYECWRMGYTRWGLIEFPIWPIRLAATIGLGVLSTLLGVQTVARFGHLVACWDRPRKGDREWNSLA